MEYTFEILGISPVLDFFNYQHKFNQKTLVTGIEYLGTYQCTLDAFLESVENVPPKQGWNMDRVVDTVISFWMNNSDSIRYWKDRLKDAGSENLLIGRVADVHSLRSELESLLGKKG